MGVLGQARVIDYVRPLLPILPEISPPERRVPFREKVAWTMFALFIFLAACQIPLYGVPRNINNDPFFWLRIVMASNQGTLMELGISPIITASMIMQLLTGAKLIQFDPNSKSDKILEKGTSKLLGILIAMVSAAAYVFSGMYGPFAEVGLGNAVAIVAQLTFSGIVVLLFDEMLQGGYGFGSAISLFIATNVCETVAWQALSMRTIQTMRGPEYEGAIIAFFHFLWSKSNKFVALREALYRSGAPNLTSLIATGIVFGMVIYFQSFRLDIPVKDRRVRGHAGVYPIKLFYTSNMPIILQSAAVSNFYFFSQMLSKRLKHNLLVSLLGQWQEVEFTGQSMPVGGLAYYISPPTNLLDLFFDPIHSVIYIVFMIGTCAYFAKIWIDVSGSAPKDVARQMQQQQLMISGYRDTTMTAVLERYIPIAAMLGGVCIGALTIIADFMGAIGSGTGILLAVTIIYQYFEAVTKEQHGMGNMMVSGGAPGI